MLASAIADARAHGEEISVEAERLVVQLFQTEGRSLVRLARLFVDDRDAAEDLVQEAFLRLARHAGRIDDRPGAGVPALDRAQPGPRPQPARADVAAPPRAADASSDVDDDVAEVPRPVRGASARARRRPRLPAASATA